MVNIRRVSPMVRSIGTMGVVMGLVGAVTFANLQSSAVALDPNTFDSATAELAIGPGTSCPDGDITQTTGLTATLVPGVASAPFAFCLDNTGDVPLSITAKIPTDFSLSQISPSDVTLSLNCPTIGTLSGPLTAYSSAVGFPGSQLATGPTEDCTATATLSGSYSGPGGQTLTPFRIEFVGNQ